MDIPIIEAKSYSERSALEKYVRNVYDLTPAKKNAIIRGTKSELSKLGLSDKMIFWGIPCELTNTADIRKPQPAPVDRGETKPFGINGSTTKPTGI